MVRSAHTGGAHDLTSEGPPTPEVETSIALLADSIAGRADILPPAFVRSRTNVVSTLAGALDLATTPQLERTLRDSQSALRAPHAVAGRCAPRNGVRSRTPSPQRTASSASMP